MARNAHSSRRAREVATGFDVHAQGLERFRFDIAGRQDGFQLFGICCGTRHGMVAVVEKHVCDAAVLLQFTQEGCDVILGGKQDVASRPADP